MLVACCRKWNAASCDEAVISNGACRRLLSSKPDIAGVLPWPVVSARRHARHAPVDDHTVTTKMTCQAVKRWRASHFTATSNQLDSPGRRVSAGRAVSDLIRAASSAATIRASASTTTTAAHGARLSFRSRPKPGVPSARLPSARPAGSRRGSCASQAPAPA